jgi:heat shock protein HtpX
MTTFWNNTKTAMLLGLMFGLVLAVGAGVGGAMGNPTQGLIIAFLFGGLMNAVAFFFSDKIALAAMHAQEADPQRDADLYEMVERLARKANLPMPKVYICPQEVPNAFATGRSPHKAAVAVTHGAIRLLNYDELEGVMAHELAHVKNRDTLISCVAATIAGAISMLAQMTMFSSMFGGNRDQGVHPLVQLVVILIAPIAAAIIQMAVSRSREFVADANGAEIAGTPHGLIKALRKLEGINRRVPMEAEVPTQNHMFIVQPLSAGAMGGLGKLFSTHPPTAQRIAALSKHRLA